MKERACVCVRVSEYIVERSVHVGLSGVGWIKLYPNNNNQLLTLVKADWLRKTALAGCIHDSGYRELPDV
jgi:hypothetical protein